MPRIFGVNHHPEIVDRSRQLMILSQKLDRGEVSERVVRRSAREILTATYPDEDTDQRLHLTSDYTLLGPLRFHLYRQVRRARALRLRRSAGIDACTKTERATREPLHRAVRGGPWRGGSLGRTRS